MKKYICLLLLLVITLSSCTMGKPNIENEPLVENEPIIESEQFAKSEPFTENKPIINEIKALFDEADNRIFDISYPIEIEGEDFYKIVVKGKLESNQTYPIDILAVNPEGDKRYFFNKETDTYERYYTVPTFACKTSPDGKLRIESVGMYMDGPSGLHSLDVMRIISMSTGDVMWSADSFLANEFLWSEDSRFVSAGSAGRQWRQTGIVDTKDYSAMEVPQIDDIMKVVPDVTKPNDIDPMPTFRAIDWLSSSAIRIQFQWMTNVDTIIYGEYEWDIINNKINIKEIKEESDG